VLTHWLVGITAAGTIFQAFEVIDFWFESKLLSRYIVYAKSSVFLAISVIKIILILTNAPLIAFAWAGLAEIVIGAIGAVLVYLVNGKHPGEWRARMEMAVALFKDSWPLLLSGIVANLHAYRPGDAWPDGG
jgi:PST family polysaccharide transporter